MLSRPVLLACTLLLSCPALGRDNAPSTQDLCRQATPVARDLWNRDLYDAPPGVAALMVDVIDGRLAEAREQLARLNPGEVARWRQTAMLTAIYAGHTDMVEALLGDGAVADGMGWIPPLRDSFFRQTVAAMKQDARLEGSSTVKGLAAAGLLKNEGRYYGPALVIAASCGDAATVDVLLRHHANGLARSSTNGADALTVATVLGHAEIVEHLLDHGANPCIDDRFIQMHQPDASLATIGRQKGLPAALVQRLVCPAVDTAH